jgi:transcriptional regulator with XRE-family HTH domain
MSKAIMRPLKVDHFKATVKKYCAEKKISQKELATKSGFSGCALTKMWLDGVGNPAYVIAISHNMETDPMQFFEEDKDIPMGGAEPKPSEDSRLDLIVNLLGTQNVLLKQLLSKWT